MAERERERFVAAGGAGALQAGGADRRAIKSHYIWVTGMLQLQQADKTLLCKRSDEGCYGCRGLWFQGRSVYSEGHMWGEDPDNIAADRQQPSKHNDVVFTHNNSDSETMTMKLPL